MRIFNEYDDEILEYDERLGKITEEKILVKHHDAIEEVEEIGHYETIAEYPNGGRDVEWVVDVEAVEHQDAWDEYEDILRFTLYTPEELEIMQEESERIQARDSLLSSLPEVLSEIDEAICTLYEMTL